ncbi:hypothetical protein AVDCRST_MAG81-5421 [uncultured Synechococcales cyanobacterium]|uniref:Uncharacterized protein n=1 Tax=uncultured Synechococcales cyanobacterium TaxID=1936017 RepID=A0A6J4VWR4_9CYAN|nr:hypothetical protein AVDCRST_MAG81-5421 [uncultured Synechococcales cyanobacterium]
MLNQGLRGLSKTLTIFERSRRVARSARLARGFDPVTIVQ